MVRDRLEELKEKANQPKNRNNRMESVIEIEEKGLNTVFELAEEIGERIENIHENVEKCCVYMKEIFESPFEEKELSHSLTQLFQENGRLTRIIAFKLKKFEDIIKNTKKTCTVERIEMIQYNTLKSRLKECLERNNDQMEIFKSHRINTYKKQLKVKGAEITEKEFSEILSGHQQQIFNGNILIETAEAKRLISEAEELNEQLLKIEFLISDIRDLFVQMSVLVEEQQELIDVVEFQTQKAAEYVEKTPVILREAELKKRKALKTKMMCFVIIGIVILIVLLSFIYT